MLSGDSFFTGWLREFPLSTRLAERYKIYEVRMPLQSNDS